MRKRTLTGLIFLLILGFASPLWAQSGASVQYVYDALGRLTTVVDPSGGVIVGATVTAISAEAAIGGNAPAPVNCMAWATRTHRPSLGSPEAESAV